MATSPICPKDFEQANFGKATCDLLTQLLLTNEKLYKWFDWLFNDDCKLSPEFGAELVELLPPIGSTFWSPLDLPVDPQVWVKCNGDEYAKEGEYAKLYAIVGDTWGQAPYDPPSNDTRFRVPNVNGRFMLAAGKRKIVQPVPPIDPPIPEAPSYAVGQTGGEDDVALEEPQLAEHVHGTLGRNNNQVPPVTNRTEEDIAGVRWLGSPQEVKPFNGQMVDAFLKPLEPITAGYNRVDAITTEQVNPPFVADPGEPHPNMPPFMGGNVYMRANHKINGKLIA